MVCHPRLRLTVAMLLFAAVIGLAACASQADDPITVQDQKEVQGTAETEAFRVDNKSGADSLKQDMRAQKQYTHEITITPNPGVKINTQQARAEILKFYNVPEGKTAEDQVCVIPIEVPAQQVYLYDIEWREVWREGTLETGRPDGTPEGTYRFKQGLLCQVVGVRPEK